MQCPQQMPIKLELQKIIIPAVINNAAAQFLHESMFRRTPCTAHTFAELPLKGRAPIIGRITSAFTVLPQVVQSGP